MQRILPKVYTQILIFSILISPIIMQAQYQAGILAGFNNNDLSAGRYTNYELFSYSPGYAIGIHINKTLHKHLKLETEIAFHKRSILEVKKSDDYHYQTTGKKLKQNSINLPIYLTYKNENLHLLSGIYCDYIVSTSVSGPFENTIIQSATFNKKIDAGYLFGGYYQLHQINIGVRYFHGLVKLSTIKTLSEPLREIQLYQLKNLQFFVKYNI